VGITRRATTSRPAGWKELIAAEWRERLFLATSAITADAAESFDLPRNRPVIVGSDVDV
jgi:K+ transporter